MKRMIIFDIDGTLMDSNWVHVEKWQQAFEQFGVIIDPLDILAQIGRSSDDILHQFLTPDQLKKIGEKIRRTYRLNYSHQIREIKEFPGVKELFLELKKRGKIIVLASSARKKAIQHYIDLLDVSDLIDGFTSTSEVKAGKPAPDIFQVALRKVGGQSQEAVVVGDSVWDMRAAVRAGIDPIGVLSGGIPASLLRKGGAKEVYRDITELYKKLNNSLITGN
ncbi:MAG: HAD family hydrolase [Actinomycetota bacterium]|nr:HAD family hydrolase [Actinomycetota bacterium]